jgi:hypothetical protein
MMRSAPVFQWVLQERKSGNTDSIKGLVIGSTRASYGTIADRACSQIREGFEPLRNNRAKGIVAAQVHAANPPAAGVDVEVNVQRRVLR